MSSPRWKLMATAIAATRGIDPGRPSNLSQVIFTAILPWLSERRAPGFASGPARGAPTKLSEASRPMKFRRGLGRIAPVAFPHSRQADAIKAQSLP